MLGPFAAAYVLSYLFRSVNAVLAVPLRASFGLGDSDLGLVTGAYFLAFAAFQLPLGLLLDRFGPRRTNGALLVVAAAGALVFARAEGVAGLIAGRALVGLGVSGCLMSSIKAAVLWFPIHRLPALNGWVFFAGGLGVIAATAPVEAALSATDWRGLFLLLAALTALAALGVLAVVPERARGAAAPAALGAQIAELAAVVRDRRFWSVALATTPVQAYNMAFQSLWAGPWLREAVGLPRAEAAFDLLLMALGTTAGFLAWGHLAGRLGGRGVRPERVFAVGAIAFLAVQVLVLANRAALAPGLCLGFGLVGTAGSLAFSMVSSRFPGPVVGRATTALNLLVFGLAFVVQWAFGLVLERAGFRPACATFLCVQVVCLAAGLRAITRAEASLSSRGRAR